jgi:DNA invertase Pin-like site-specific DNA recombinase
MSDKIKPQHLSRKAILYVRQSSPYQVMNNLESQQLQYAMEAHLRSLGWSEVEIIDEDLGRSAGGSVTRTGFERMVAQVCLGKWVRSVRVRFLASRGTAASGSSW